MSASRPIDPGTYQRLRELFLAAIELPKDEQRRVIDERCEDDQLRARLEAMLRLDATRKLEVDGERSFDEVANIADLATDDLGPYRILEPLGEGGFCVVFLAEQIAPVRRNVALKLIKPGMDTRSVLARFEAERQALALMSHPAIAKVYDSGVSAKGRAFFAMEHVPGEPITTYCDRRGLTIRERLLLFIRVCEAVQHAHQKAIIHRDLKPSNILVADVDGKAMPKVIDFGIAKSLGQSLTERTLHTREGQFIGTPAYMSPEQAESSAADVDTRADIYSLGIILYELLVGCRPFDARSFGSSDLVALKRILSEHPPRPSARLASLDDEARRRYARLRQRDPRGLARELRGDLDWITLRAIAKSRGDRYGTPTELAQDIERHLRHEPVSASPPTLAYRVRKLCARHRVIVAAAAMMIATLGIAFAVSFVLWLRTKDALERSEGLRLTALSTATVGENPDVALLLALEGHERYRGIESRNAVIAALLELVPHRVQRGHESLVVAVATHPEGDLVASSSEDGQVLLWSSRTLERKGELAPPGGGKSWIRLAFDGSGAKLRGAASDGSAAEWRVSTNERVASLEPLSSRVAWIGWALDPARVNVVTEDGLFLSRSIEGGHVLHRVETGVRDVTAAALAPDAESLALGTRTGEIFLVETGGTSTARPLRLGRHRRAVHTLELDPSGSGRLLSADLHDAHVYDVATRHRLFVLDGHQPILRAAAYSPDGRTIVTAADDRTAILWNALDGSRSQVLRGHASRVTHASFSADGKHVATGSIDRTTRIWAVDTGKLVATLPGHGAKITALEFDSKGETIVTVSEGREVYVWEFRRRAVPHLQDEPNLKEIAVSPDAQTIAGAPRDVVASIWSVATAERRTTDRRSRAELTHVSFTADGKSLFTESWEGTFRLWDPETGREMRVFTRPGGYSHSALAPDGRSVVLAHENGGRIDLVDMASGEIVRSFDVGPAQVWSVGFSPPGIRSIYAATDQGIIVWDLVTSERAAVLSGHTSRIRSVEWQANEATIASACYDGTARIWDARSGFERHRLAHPMSVFLATYRSRKAELLTASFDSVARIWDVETGTLLRALSGHEGRLTCATYSPDGRLVLTGSYDGTVRIWNADSGEEIMTFRGHQDRICAGASFTPDGAQVISASIDGAIRIWPVDPLPLAQELKPRGFTVSERAIYGLDPR